MYYSCDFALEIVSTVKGNERALEIAKQIKGLYASWNTTLDLSSEYSSSGDFSLKFTPYAQWSHFGFKGIFGVDELNLYKSISIKV